MQSGRLICPFLNVKMTRQVPPGAHMFQTSLSSIASRWNYERSEVVRKKLSYTAVRVSIARLPKLVGVCLVLWARCWLTLRGGSVLPSLFLHDKLYIEVGILVMCYADMLESLGKYMPTTSKSKRSSKRSSR